MLTLAPNTIRDSRGRPTVAVTLKLGDLSVTGDVPAGASTGEDEARTVPVEKALAQIRDALAPMVAHARLENHDELIALERRLIAAAGDNCALIAANALLPVSRALWRAVAARQDMTLCEYIRAHEPELASRDRVLFYMNIFNGGLHALKKADGEQLGRDRVDIQEMMVVPVSAKMYRDALAMGEAVDGALKARLAKEFGGERLSRADEAGFSVKGLGQNHQALTHVAGAVADAGMVLGKDIKLALDVAASSFFDPTTRRYAYEGAQLTTAEMSAKVLSLVDRYPGSFLSVEDPLDENDWEGWQALSVELAKRGIKSIGDDLFVTQRKRLDRGIASKAAHAILIKVNQNGSVTGTLDVMKHAKKNGIACVVSHRSGETLDDSIADLAMATGAFGLKTGAPQPAADFPDRQTWVRRNKYLRMITLEEAR